MDKHTNSSNLVDASALTSTAKIFFLSCFTLAIPAWQLAFNFGVYRTVFFEHLHLIMVASLTTFFASFWLPKKQRWLRPYEQTLLLVPALVFLCDSFIRQGNLPDWVLWVQLAADLFILAFCLPYLFYLIAGFTHPELIESLNRRQFMKMATVVACVACLGWLAGVFHPLHMQCQDFAISGNAVPDNCRQGAAILPNGEINGN